MFIADIQKEWQFLKMASCLRNLVRVTLNKTKLLSFAIVRRSFRVRRVVIASSLDIKISCMFRGPYE